MALDRFVRPALVSVGNSRRPTRAERGASSYLQDSMMISALWSESSDSPKFRGRRSDSNLSAAPGRAFRSEGEHMVTPILRSIGDEWPLPIENKQLVAEVFAYQLLRGTKWKDEYEERTRAIFDEYRKDPAERSHRGAATVAPRLTSRPTARG